MATKQSKPERIALSAYLNSWPDDKPYELILIYIACMVELDELIPSTGCQDWNNMYLIECIEALKETLERALNED